MKVKFEYDGEMTADVALNKEKLAHYPFCRLTAPANIATKLLEEMGSCTVVGPILTGFERSVQIVPMGSGVNEILNMAALAAVESNK